MACGCGGSNAGSGGCGGHQPVASHALVDEALVVNAMEAPVAVDAAPQLIASSEQEWPRIRVNGLAIEPEAIAHELQYHPAASREEAVYLASQALVIRALLQQRITELGLIVRGQPGESEEEAATRTLLEQELPLPQADEATCRQYFENNREHFASAPLLMARHILLACAGDDAEGRSRLRETATVLIEQLAGDPSRFGELALEHSACPSKSQGGALGQISKGQTVPEFERQLFRLQPGLALQPIESRYGFHVVWVDKRIEGQLLPYEAVAESIRNQLDQRVWRVGVSQYLQGLVGAADIEGIRMQGAETPLMQ